MKKISTKIILSSLVFLTFFLPIKSFAYLPNFSTGGRILWVDFCECQAGFVVLTLHNTGGIPIPLPILFQPGFSMPRMNYMFIPGGTVLGTAVPGGACSQIVSRGFGTVACIPLPLAGTYTPAFMSGVGTAMPPIF
jgi:hypothetical protein